MVAKKQERKTTSLGDKNGQKKEDIPDGFLMKFNQQNLKNLFL